MRGVSDIYSRGAAFHALDLSDHSGVALAIDSIFKLPHGSIEKRTPICTHGHEDAVCPVRAAMAYQKTIQIDRDIIGINSDSNGFCCGCFQIFAQIIGSRLVNGMLRCPGRWERENIGSSFNLSDRIARTDNALVNFGKGFIRGSRDSCRG